MGKLSNALLALLMLVTSLAAAPAIAGAAQAVLYGSPLAVVSSQPLQPVTVSAYRDLLQSGQRQLRERRGAAAGEIAAGLRRMSAVVMPDGSRVRPDLAAPITALEMAPPDVAAAEAGLQTLLAELDRAETAGRARGNDDARTRLQRVLERSEFNARPRVNAFDELVLRAWTTLVEWVGRLSVPLALLFPGLDLRLLAALAGLLLVGGLVFWAVRGLRRTMGPEVYSAPTSGDEARTTPEELRGRALELAERGEFRSAVRVLYLAVLLQWDERGKLRFDRALTNREVLAQLGDDEDAVAIRRLRPLVERFDRSWYGAAPCSLEEYAEFERLAMSAWEPA